MSSNLSSDYELTYPSLASDASQLYLANGTLYLSGTDESTSRQIKVGTSYNTWGDNASLSSNNTGNPINLSLASTGSGLYAISPTWATTSYVQTSGLLTILPLTVTTAAAVQKSLAGYSIDGNVDVNGDGFSDMLISDPSNPTAGIDNQYVLFGGDYLDLASQVGTEANDTLIGTPLADVIYSIGGADVVQSNGGADVIYTGSGDDQVLIKDSSFWRIDAGSGFDQLLLQGLANQSYNFQLNTTSPQYFAGTKLRDIELISSLGYGANALSFDAAAVNAFNSDRILFLTCDTTDSIALSNEFERDARFDSDDFGKTWYAYAAHQQAGLSNNAALNGNPALVYVLAAGNVSIATTNATTANATAPALSADQSSLQKSGGYSPDWPASRREPITLSDIASSTDLGNGVALLAYKTTSSSAAARFEIRRSNTSERQVFLYASSSTNATASPGRDCDAVAGLLVLEAGEARKEITVPIDSEAFQLMRRGSLSLQVEELPDQGQNPLHLLIRPEAPAALPAERPTAPPVLSGFELTPSADGAAASLRFRADTNGESSGRDHLQLVLSQRASASSSAVLSSQSVALLDASVQATLVAQADAAPKALALDNDQRDNGQVSTHLELSFKAGVGESLVSVVLGNSFVPLLFRQQDALAILASSAEQAEGNSGSTAFTFTVTRHGESSGVSSASWAVTGSGTDPASGSDFVGGSYPTGTVSFAAGETSQTITINAAGDKMVERDESFLITLLDPSAATLDSSAAAASGIIRNDDLNQGPATYQLSGSAVVGQTLTAQLTTSDPDGDGTPAFSWQTLSAGSWSPVGQAASYLITAADEGKPLRLLIAYTDAMGSAETITMDAGTVPLMPDLAITVLTPLLSEGSIGSSSFGFQISRNGNLTGSSRVAWAVEATGTNPANTADFALNQWPAGIAEFAPGQERLIISIPVVGDGLLEPDESFRVSLSSASNGRIPLINASATSLILNDDLPAQSFNYTASSSAVYEGSAVAIGIITTNVPSGTRLHWKAGGAGITASDFIGSGLSGEVVIGNDGEVSYYSTPGASLLVASPSNGGTLGITTTDYTGSVGYGSGDYTSGFGGTSAATPIASGVVGLILEANPALGYRDGMEILAITARQIGSPEPAGAGLVLHAWQFTGVIPRSRGKETATTRLRLAGMLTSMMVSERAPSAMLVSPAPISPFAPMRLSTPMIKKFSSPFWALRSRMSLEFGSRAAMVFSRLFFALCHCHAAPVTANVDTAMSTAADRAASNAGRRRRLRARPAAAIGTVASTPASGESAPGEPARCRVTGARRLLPVTLASTSATATPSVWCPDVPGTAASPARPGVAFSPSLIFQPASGFQIVANASLRPATAMRDSPASGLPIRRPPGNTRRPRFTTESIAY